MNAPLLSHSFSLAHPALACPLAWSAEVGVCVFWRELMAVIAMCLGCVNCAGAGVSQDVDSYRYNFKVRWIHTQLVFAQMIDSHPIGYCSNQQLIGHSMCPDGDGWPLSDCEAPVSTIHCASPIPAAIRLFDITPEPFLERAEPRRSQRISIPLKPHVMHSAKPTADAAFSTPVYRAVLNRS